MKKTNLICSRILNPEICNLGAQYSNQLKIGGTVLICTLLIWIVIAWWRAHCDALSAKGWSTKSGAMWAFRWKKDIFIYAFRRDITADLIMKESRFLEQKTGIIPHSVKERTWPRFLFVKSFIRIYQEHFPEIITFKSCQKFMKDEQVCIGRDGFGSPVILQTQNIGSVTIGGKSGGGKTTLTKAIFKQYRPENVFVIGGKKGSYIGAHFARVGKEHSDIQKVHEFLLHLHKEILKRDQICADYGVDDVRRLPADVKISFPRTLIILEEADSFLRISAYRKENKLLGEAIIEICRMLIKQGRAYGFLTILVNQTLQKSELDVNLREAGVVISSETDTAAISIELFAGSDCAFSKTLRNGKFIIWDEIGIRRFKSISPDHVAEPKGAIK